jgi:hypothetical protein
MRYSSYSPVEVKARFRKWRLSSVTAHSRRPSLLSGSFPPAAVCSPRQALWLDHPLRCRLSSACSRPRKWYPQTPQVTEKFRLAILTQVECICGTFERTKPTRSCECHGSQESSTLKLPNRVCAAPLMAFISPHKALESYIDIPFNVWFSIILIITYGCAIRNRGLLLIVVLGVSAIIVVFDKTSTAGELTKIICELPLGLGSVLAFLVANRSFQSRFLPAFTVYVNLAVYGNIGMMVWTPADGTLRGMCSKVTCIALFIWIVQQGHRVRWKTIVLHDNLFIFNAVNKSWIFAHAIYRFILLTLPCFKFGRRYRLLELYSLTLTFILSSISNLPFEYCFGMADTLVVPTITGWSAIATTFNLIPRNAIDNDSLSNRIGNHADVYLSAVSLAVTSFVCFKIANAPRQES